MPVQVIDWKTRFQNDVIYQITQWSQKLARKTQMPNHHCQSTKGNAGYIFGNSTKWLIFKYDFLELLFAASSLVLRAQVARGCLVSRWVVMACLVLDLVTILHAMCRDWSAQEWTIVIGKCHRTGLVSTTEWYNNNNNCTRSTDGCNTVLPVFVLLVHFSIAFPVRQGSPKVSKDVLGVDGPEFSSEAGWYRSHPVAQALPASMYRKAWVKNNYYTDIYKARCRNWRCWQSLGEVRMIQTSHDSDLVNQKNEIKIIFAI